MLPPVEIEHTIFRQYLAVLVITEKMNTCSVGWLKSTVVEAIAIIT